MISLKPYKECGFVKTTVEKLSIFSHNKNIFLKIESENLNGNIKSRPAYFMFADIVAKNNTVNIVESSSGNLGLSLGYFANQLGYRFLCLVDPTVPAEKIKQLEEYHIQYESVQLGNFPDYRSARMDYAQALSQKSDWIWTNQYRNSANARAHYITTGPELWEQMHGEIDYFVCSVGSGGTISGVARYLKEQNPNIIVVAVEPRGSTIFGGEPSKYLTAGAGLSYPSHLLECNIQYIDYYTKVDDACAIATCIDIANSEGLSVGITSGSVLYAAHQLSRLYSHKRIACIAPDGGNLYKQIISVYNNAQSDDNFALLPVKRGGGKMNKYGVPWREDD